MDMINLNVLNRVIIHSKKLYFRENSKFSFEKNCQKLKTEQASWRINVFL